MLHHENRNLDNSTEPGVYCYMMSHADVRFKYAVVLVRRARMPAADEEAHAALMRLLPPGMHEPMTQLIRRKRRFVHCALHRAFEWHMLRLSRSCDDCREIYWRQIGYRSTAARISQGLPRLQCPEAVRQMHLCEEHMENIEEHEVPLMSSALWHVLVRVGTSCRLCRGEI